MQIQPFLLLKQSQTTLAMQRADSALAQWETQWCSLGDHRVSCVAASDAAALPPAAEWRQRILANGRPVWLWSAPETPVLLGRQLFMPAEPGQHGQRNSALATGVAQTALEDLLRQLTEQVGAQPSLTAAAAPFPAAMLRYGSGALVCRLDLTVGQILLLLPAEVPTATAQPPRPALRSLHQALTALPVTLQVQLSEAELTLGYLNTLAVGDVLTLPTQVDQTLQVLGPGGSAICRAHLGTCGGMHAVELIK